jgi:hypothetical protein
MTSGVRRRRRVVGTPGDVRLYPHRARRAKVREAVRGEIEMEKKRRIRVALAATAALAATWVVPALPASAVSEGDWINVTQVLVNRLGGVNVSGQVSCEGTYQQILAGDLEVQDSQGNVVPLELQPGDKVNLFANHDNYTVSQPAGRKAMIQVTHESSRMNPCLVQYRFSPDGTPMPDSVGCAPDGYPCRWETDAFSYDRASQGPLFDYAANGKFKAGLLNVSAHSVGLLVTVAHFTDEALTGWDVYFVSEGSYATTSALIKAVNYRG